MMRISELRDENDGKMRVWKDPEAEEHFGKPWCVTGLSIKTYEVYKTWQEALGVAIRVAELDCGCQGLSHRQECPHWILPY